MLFAEVEKISPNSQTNTYAITCPICSNIRTVTATSPNLDCKCGNYLGDYILLIDNECVRVSEHINEVP